MASNDHPQSDSAGPAADSSVSIPAAPVFSSTLETRDVAPNTSAPDNAHQNLPTTSPVLDTLDSAATAPPQERTTEAIPPAVSLGDSDHQNAPSSQGLPSDEPLPSLEQPEPKQSKPESSGPCLRLVIMLVKGTRHPINIDENYLREHEVTAPNDDPFAMNVYSLKELLWKGWQDDWEARPSNPSFIRLISFGKLLDNNAPLLDSKFSRDGPNVVHISVIPQEMVDEEDTKAPKSQHTRDREVNERSPRCRCVIQ